MTPRQLECLNFIKAYTARNGFSPTLQEIADEMDVAKVTVFEFVTRLQRGKLISRTPHLERGIIVLPVEPQQSPLRKWAESALPILRGHSPQLAATLEPLLARGA